MQQSSRIRRASLILAGAFALVLAVPNTALAAPLAALPANADTLDQTFQPAYDYDTDGCYATPAIGPDGTINPGLKPDRSPQRQLPGRVGPGQHQRVLARQVQQRLVRRHLRPLLREGPGRPRHQYRRAPPRLGARRGLGAEQPGPVRRHLRARLFQHLPGVRVRCDGTHAKVVYHKDGVSTHCFRLANSNDEPPENHQRTWQFPRWSAGTATRRACATSSAKPTSAAPTSGSRTAASRPPRRSQAGRHPVRPLCVTGSPLSRSPAPRR